MTNIPSAHIKRFLAAAALALALPAAMAAGPGGCAGGEERGEIRGEGRGGAGRRGGDVGPAGRLPGDQPPPYLRALNLSEAQRDKVFDILHGQAPALRDKARALHRAEEELRQLTAAGDYSEARARTLADAAGRQSAEVALIRARADRQIYELLTPEQRKQLAELKSAGEPSRPDGRPPR